MHKCLAVCSLLLLVGLVQAADDSLVVNESLESRVQQLVLELDAPQLAQRNAAEQALQELGEEGVETALAAVVQGDDELVGEAADLTFHLMVLLRARGLSFDQVLRKLISRHS